MNSTALSCITCSLFSMHKSDKQMSALRHELRCLHDCTRWASHNVIAEEIAIAGTIVCKSHDAVVCDPPELITHDADSSMPLNER